MRNLMELKINDGGKPVSLPPPTDEDVSHIEKYFGLIVPMSLISFLRFSNGGHPEVNAVGGVDGQYAINRFYHLTSDVKDSEGLWSAINTWRPILGNEAIPFANDGGDNQFFLDLSDSPPSVKVCLHDEGMKKIMLSKTFDEFIDGLDFDEDMI